MTDPDHKSDQPEEAPRTILHRGDAKARGEVTRSPDPANATNADVYLEGVASDQLAEDPAALREQVLGEAGQRSGSRLDADRGYGAGHAARDARAAGTALGEDGDST